MAVLSATNPWSGFLNDNPQTLYNAMIPNGSKNFTEYYLANYNKIYNNYLSTLAKNMLGGGSPTDNFSDYLNNYNFKNQWNMLTPWGRGLMNPGRVNWNV